MKRVLEKSVAAVLTCAIILSTVGCGSGVISKTGKIDPPQSSSSTATEQEQSGEFPPANEELLAGEDSNAAKAESEAAAKAESEAAAKAESEAAARAESEATAKAESEAAAKAESEAAHQENIPDSTASVPDEVKAIWISYLDFYSLAQNQGEAAFTSNMNSAFDNIADMGLNTVFVQVRPFGDAIYDSDIFPWSHVLTETEGQSPGYDPLEIMTSLARQHNLRIEAWINPYRVRSLNSSRKVSSANPAVKAIRAGEDTAIEFGGGIFYNPSSEAAWQIITDGVVEIIENYDIDGIHFDDYFYPTTDMSFDSKYYKRYTSAGGTLSQADWRRENVNKLIKKVYSAVKNTDSSVVFGISPQASFSNNYNGQFADVEKWLSSDGYVDYICPQIYYGFENSTAPYDDTLATWASLAKNGGVDLYIGLAVYKCGTVDKWAGSGANEWINNTDIISRMITAARKKACYSGFVLYRYDSVFNPESAVKSYVRKELSSLCDIL